MLFGGYNPGWFRDQWHSSYSESEESSEVPPVAEMELTVENIQITLNGATITINGLTINAQINEPPVIYEDDGTEEEGEPI